MPRLKYPQINIRPDAPTLANIRMIISSGIAHNQSDALRAAAAALARGLVSDPRVWVVHQDGMNWGIFATESAAIAHLESLGAAPTCDASPWWQTLDNDGDVIATYEIEAVTPQ